MINDWVQYSPPTTYQGNCGSCTAFTGCRDMSTIIKILTGEDVRFSEQDLLACSGGSCERGNTVEGLISGMKRGVALAECCPYQERTTRCGEGRCPDWTIGARKIKSATKLNTYAQLKEALSKGPVMASMAVPQSFTIYKIGKYTGQLGTHDPIVGYHMVEIHGQDTEKETVLLSNHWRNWGFRINDTHDSYGNIDWDATGCELEYWEVEMSDDPVKPDEEPEPDGWKINPVMIIIIILIIIAILIIVTR